MFVSGFPTDPALKGPTLIFFYQFFLKADIPRIIKLLVYNDIKKYLKKKKFQPTDPVKNCSLKPETNNYFFRPY